MLLFYILPHLPMATPTTAGYGNISTNSATPVSLSLSLLQEIVPLQGPKAKLTQILEDVH